MDYVKSRKIILKNHPELTEKWLQEKIAETPEILGLGENLEWRRYREKTAYRWKVRFIICRS